MRLRRSEVSDRLESRRLHLMRNRNAIISLFAAILLLGLIFIEPQRLHASDRKFTQYEGLYCNVAVSSTVTLAESKPPRVDSFDVSSLLNVVFSDILLHPSLAECFTPESRAICFVPQPLWLLKRSLLI
jgi:drug/metabolite transporter superfamily protein YnfA